MTEEIKRDITKLLHLAIIAQIQAWEAITNLEMLLSSELTDGSQEWRANNLAIGDVIQEIACENKQLPELLAGVDADELIVWLREFPLPDTEVANG